jgi:glycosyltransferase involved in cell wall biosynthesis
VTRHIVEARRVYVSVAYTHAATDSRVRRHCETLARRRWRVFQLGLAAGEESLIGRLNDVILVRKPQSRYRGSRLLRYAWGYLSFLVWARLVLRRLARRRRVAVVQANNIPNFVVWAAAGLRRSGTKVILDIHDPVPELFQSKFSNTRGATLAVHALRWEERVSTLRADVVLCVHEPHRELTERHGVDPKKLRVVLNAADAQLFPLQPPRESSPFVVYHGTVAARMGLDVVVRAIALMRAAGRDVRGAILGDGDAVPALQKLRDEERLQDFLEIPGRRFRLEELLSWLTRVGVEVVPMRRDVFTDLMLPVKLIESVRLGIPSVVTWTPTVARYFPENTVWYLREFAPLAFAKTLAAVLDNPQEARLRASEAQKLPIARGWQEMEEPYVETVEEVANLGVAR